MKIVPCVKKTKTKQNKTKENKNRKTVQVDYFSVNTCRGKGWGQRLLERNLEPTTSLLENRMKLMVALSCSFF